MSSRSSRSAKSSGLRVPAQVGGDRRRCDEQIDRTPALALRPTPRAAAYQRDRTPRRRRRPPAANRTSLRRCGRLLPAGASALSSSRGVRPPIQAIVSAEPRSRPVDPGGRFARDLDHHGRVDQAARVSGVSRAVWGVWSSTASTSFRNRPRCRRGAPANAPTAASADTNVRWRRGVELDRAARHCA